MGDNQTAVTWQNTFFEWADECDAKPAQHIKAGNHQVLIDYRSLGPDAYRVIPTNQVVT